MYIQIALLILILASFVIAFFSARTWHWGHVLVVLGIFLSTLGFFILAAETLRINAVLRSQVNNLQRDLTDVQARNEALDKGTEDPGLITQLRNEEVRIPGEELRSLNELEHQLLLKTRERGRLWRNVTPTNVDPQTGVVQIAVERPTPAGFKSESVVALFEQGEPQLPGPDGTPRGAQYLGEFRVTQADAQTARLEPVLSMDNFERQRLAQSRGPWIMYDTMPADRHQIFAGMSEDELKQKLPPQSVEEYLRHGKPAGPDDEPLRQAGFDETGKRLPPDQLGQAARRLYQRRLRDYAEEFDELARRRTMLSVDIEAVQKDNERLKTALASAEELKSYREEDLRKLNIDLEGVKKERDAIEQHLAKLQQNLARGRQLLAETLQHNSEMAGQLRARQGQSRGPAGGATSDAVTGPLALDGVN